MRVARRWYGVDANLPFEEGVNPESKKIISHDGHVRCKEALLSVCASRTADWCGVCVQGVRYL